MQEIDKLFKNNQEWAEKIKAEDPEFFSRLAEQQNPEYLWIGCADSRVPANQLMGLVPGEVFVHRNIANCVLQTDLNCQSVIYYAIAALKVKHIIVTGHYNCGGVKAATEGCRHGPADHWIANIRRLYAQKQDELASIESEEDRINRLCELNVQQQVTNVSHSIYVQEAWAAGQELTIHGCIYDLRDGLLKNLVEPISGLDGVEPLYRLY
ncbi:carbonic anhydrase [Agaribacterium sp. ZY112]|uniref:carbonic anhydrase n=1 Tax=Agaribacterium sp. ZY112 TaxID=3233574 RepID=UPI003524B4F3